MAFKSLAFRPGVNTQLTKTLLGDGYSNSQLIRHLSGQPQKYGGWMRLTSQQLIGTCRGLFAWDDLFGNAYLAAGTEQEVAIYFGGYLYNITPLTHTSTIAATTFATTMSSNIVTVTDVGYQPNAGDWIYIVKPVSIGGAGSALVVQGLYEVATSTLATNSYTFLAASNAPSTSSAGAVPYFTTTNLSDVVTVTLHSHGLVNGNSFTVHYTTTVGGIDVAPLVTIGGVTQSPPTAYTVAGVTTDTFTITVSAPATSGASAYEGAANNAVIQYYLPNGYAVDTTTPTGGGNVIYGTGTYGAGPYGGGLPVGSQITPLRQWFFNSWGQTLVANPTNGALYYWVPPSIPTNPLAFSPPATQANLQIIPNAPIYNTLSLVVPQAQILVAFGAESGGMQYPYLIKWSDVADYTDWTPTATNEAGSFSLPSGSKIVSAIVSGLSILIWTDTDLWSMTYQGLPFVFDFQKIGINCEALSAKSVGQIGQRICWPSLKGFYQFDGAAVAPLVCPVWDYFFTNLDFSNLDQVFCATNTLFTEFMWFFTSTDNDVHYVKYNILENVWDIGVLTRTAWVDHSAFGNPIGVDGNRLLQQHEMGNDADGQPMSCFITTGFSPISDGEEFSYVDAFFPDFITQGTSPSMQITFYGAASQNSTPVTYGPYNFSPSTEYVSIRIRGRLLGYTISSSDAGSFWRCGKPYLRIAPAGRRA